MCDPEYRQYAADRVESKREKIERPISVMPAHSPAHQEGQHLSGDKNPADLDQSQNSGGQPKARQNLDVPPNASVGDGPGRGTRSRNGRGANPFPAGAAELRAGGDRRPAFIAKHGLSLLLPEYADPPGTVPAHAACS